MNMRIEIIRGDGWRFETENSEVYLPDKYCFVDVESADAEELEDLVDGEVLDMTRLEDYYFGRVIDPLTEEAEPWYADEDKASVKEYLLSEHGDEADEDDVDFALRDEDY